MTSCKFSLQHTHDFKLYFDGESMAGLLFCRLQELKIRRDFAQIAVNLSVQFFAPCPDLSSPLRQGAFATLNSDRETAPTRATSRRPGRCCRERTDAPARGPSAPLLAEWADVDKIRAHAALKSKTRGRNLAFSTFPPEPDVLRDRGLAAALPRSYAPLHEPRPPPRRPQARRRAKPRRAAARMARRDRARGRPRCRCPRRRPVRRRRTRDAKPDRLRRHRRA
jgi:hypothetical protein